VVASYDENASATGTSVDSTQLRYIAEAIPQMVWTCTAEGKLEYANQLFCNYSNRPYDQSLGDRWLEQCHPDEVELVRESWIDHIKAQKPFDAEFRWRRADGVYRWHSCSVIPLKDGNGKIYRWLGTNTDMQDQKQARERVFRAVFDNAYQLMTLIDLRGKVLEANAPALNLIKAKLKDVKGKLIWETPWFNYSREIQAKIIESVKQAADGEFVRFEFVYHGPHGSLTYFDYSVKPILDESGAPNMLVAEARDITERKVAEQRIQISENHYRGIFDNASDLIVSINPDGAIIYANRAWHDTLGYNQDLLQLLNLFDVVAPDKKTEVLEIFEQLKEGRSNGRLETSLISADGRILEVDGSLNRDLLHNAHLTTAIFRDNSVRKEMQRKVSEFYSNVSHELRTPLTSIKASLGLIEGGLAGPISDKALKLIHIGREESDRLIRMVNDILDIKKVESGFLGLRREPLTPAELIGSTCDGMMGMADELQVTLKQVVEKNEPFFGDKDRLIQILTNYISNALKHSPKGGQVEIRSSVGLLKANNVRFSVIDNGPGIAQENLEKLFGMFQQLSASSTNHGLKGSGLGLALSKSLVELHGGKVGCSSKFGDGACFWFEVPSGSGPGISF
jgi:PAS domain S-box-containing protein